MVVEGILPAQLTFKVMACLNSDRMNLVGSPDLNGKQPPKVAYPLLR
jgi:hypothetical protein